MHETSEIELEPGLDRLRNKIFTTLNFELVYLKVKGHASIDCGQLDRASDRRLVGAIIKQRQIDRTESGVEKTSAPALTK